MKISDLRKVNQLSNIYSTMECLFNNVIRFEYIRAVAYDSHRSYDLPNDPRLKQYIEGAFAEYMLDLKNDLAQLGVEVDE